MTEAGDFSLLYNNNNNDNNAIDLYCAFFWTLKTLHIENKRTRKGIKHGPV